VDHFHPTFLYESICSLISAAILIRLLLRYSSQRWWRDGYALALYLCLYGFVRLVIESMRTDSLYIGFWPAAYWLSGALVLAGVALAVILSTRKEKGVK
jgi:phosphatidylglycerol:prolipoprotein diacylglycerol transferase